MSLSGTPKGQYQNCGLEYERGQADIQSIDIARLACTTAMTRLCGLTGYLAVTGAYGGRSFVISRPQVNGIKLI